MPLANLFLSPHGRIGRLSYLLGVISLAVVQGLLIGIFVASRGKGAPAIVFGLLFLALGYPQWMLNIKRAHDLDKSGWWVFGCIFLLPIVGLGLAGAGKVAAANHNLGLALLLLLAALPFSLSSLWVFIKMFFFSGSLGINIFGPPSNFLRQIFGDEGDVPVTVAPAVARVLPVMTPPPAPRPQPTAPRAPRPAGFGRRGLTPA